jgi:ATP-dependent Lon protease
LAAKTAGIKMVLVPNQNEKDVAEIATEIKSGMEIVFVESMDDVIGYAFSEPVKSLKSKSTKRKPKTESEEN